jgi:hypothetical protein
MGKAVGSFKSVIKVTFEFVDTTDLYAASILAVVARGCLHCQILTMDFECCGDVVEFDVARLIADTFRGYPSVTKLVIKQKTAMDLFDVLRALLEHLSTMTELKTIVMEDHLDWQGLTPEVDLDNPDLLRRVLLVQSLTKLTLPRLSLLPKLTLNFNSEDWTEELESSLAHYIAESEGVRSLTLACENNEGLGSSKALLDAAYLGKGSLDEILFCGDGFDLDWMEEMEEAVEYNLTGRNVSMVHCSKQLLWPSLEQASDSSSWKRLAPLTT